MLNRYRDIELCKSDIKQFVELVIKDIGEVSVDDLNSIAKNMILIKKVYFENKHYYNCLISDMFLLLHTLGKDSIRSYFTTRRSLIENFVRVILKYQDNNSTGILNMFKEFRNNFESQDKIFIDYLEGEYGKCCDVVHSNKKANLTMYAYYEELIKKDEITLNNKPKMLKEISEFYLKCKKFIIKCDTQSVSNAFYNHKELLYYLIGKEEYGIFERYNV